MTMFLLFRYDRLNSVMKIINCFNNADKTFFAQPGEYFGEIYLSDYLVMDEVAGHLINRSVLSVILRFKLENSQSTKAYECSIKLKTPETVIVKLNEELCKEYVLEIEQVFYIDLKFRFNRLPMCEMHQAIDMCRQKTQVLIPDIKKVSYKDKVSRFHWSRFCYLITAVFLRVVRVSFHHQRLTDIFNPLEINP